MKIVARLGLLTLPAWGTVAVIALISWLPKESRPGHDVVLFIAALLVVGGATPIFLARSFGLPTKAVLFVVYAVACAHIIFFVGWGAAGILGGGEPDTRIPSHLRIQSHLKFGLTPRWSGRVEDKVPSSYRGVRAAQLNR